MSSLAAMQKQKAAERRAQAMRMTVTKVKPTVVKHILPDEVMSIYDIKTHMQQYYQQTAENVKQGQPGVAPQLLGGPEIPTLRSASPRYFGSDSAQLYSGKSADVSRDLILQLQNGMNGLNHLKPQAQKENVNAMNAQHAVESLQKLRANHQTMATSKDFNDHETRSIHSAMTYNQSAVGEMNTSELDTLLEKNEERIKAIKERFVTKKQDIQSYHDLVIEMKDNWETKERFKDNSLSYPSYGRGLEPNIEMNTFMVQEGMTGIQKKKFGDGPSSPQCSVQAKQRRKILSPKRQRFENGFERYMNGKYVEKPIAEIPEKLKEMEAPPPFDTLTAVETMNAKVAERQATIAFVRAKKEVEGKLRSLPVIEKEAQELWENEIVVNMSSDMIENLRRVYMTSKKRDEEHLEDVICEDYLYNICDDPYLDKKLDVIVRETTDEDRESLDNLLMRVSKEHKSDRIEWMQFLVYFTKRGNLRPNEEILFSYMAIADIDTYRQESIRYEEEALDDKQWRLHRELKETLVKKQNKVLKGGKGKYDVTVPQPFDFMKHPKESKTLRQEWLDAEEKKRVKAETRLLKHQFTANEIPKSTTQPRYQKILSNNEKRRVENKDASMARTKAVQKPFSFYERDLKKKMDNLNLIDEVDTDMLNQFRARIVPWRILVPRFKMMMEKEEHEREQRIRQNAEKSFAMASLPPRMQDHEDERKRRIEEDLESTQQTVSDSIGFSFRPPRARSVPNFRKLQKTFVTQMEARKQAQPLTIPKPFKFHQNKPQANLRKYMDEQNQTINPTLKAKRAHSTKPPIQRDSGEEQPATTKKHEAYVASRRTQMEEKKKQQESNFQVEIDRFIKQNRLQQRVKCSPAIVSNTTTLRKKREMSKAIAKKNMAIVEKSYEALKADIEFKVANRPLLVEQVSQAFIHNLNQIKELQRYVTLLREAGHNPDEHLTDEQRELLVSADYYDRLNLATAYFPAQNGGQALMQEGAIPEGMDAEEGDEMGDGEDQQEVQEEVEDQDGEVEGEEEEEEGEMEEDGQGMDDEQIAQLTQILQQQAAYHLQVMTDLADAGQISHEDLNNFNQLTHEEQTAMVQALQQQQLMQMEQVGVDQREEDPNEDPNDDEEQEEDDEEGEYDGIEGMEQQIEEEGDDDDIHQPDRDQQQEGDDDEAEIEDDVEQMMDGEGDEEDGMIEIDEEELRQLLLQHQQNNMGMQGEQLEDEDDDEQ